MPYILVLKYLNRFKSKKREIREPSLFQLILKFEKTIKKFNQKYFTFRTVLTNMTTKNLLKDRK